MKATLTDLSSKVVFGTFDLGSFNENSNPTASFINLNLSGSARQNMPASAPPQYALDIEDAKGSLVANYPKVEFHTYNFQASDGSGAVVVNSNVATFKIVA